MTINHVQSKRGYTLLFSILITTFVLSIGVSILTIARKELALTGSSRDSQQAILKADSGLECAYYWDTNDPMNFPLEGETYLTTVRCDGFDAEVEILSTEIEGTLREYRYYSGSLLPAQETGPCSQVTIRKEMNLDEDGNEIYSTTIESRGYNIGWSLFGGSCDYPSPKKVERAMRYSY